MWFYKIEKEGKDIHVTWNTTMTYLKNTFGFVGIVACLFNVVWLAAICLGTLAIALAYYVYRYGNLVKDTFNKLGYKAKINTHTTSYIN